jgi:hypothetical protein
MEHHLHLQVEEADNQRETSYYIHADSVPEATKLFERARQNLLQVNRWHELAGPLSNGFQLTDEKGNIVKDRAPVPGDYIRIERANQATDTSYDWVIVEEIEERAMTAYHISATIKVRPVAMPNQSYTSQLVVAKAPVFSLFSVERIGSMVYASVYGLPKQQQNSGFLSNLRQSIIQLGTTLGLVKPEWQHLAKGVLSV